MKITVVQYEQGLVPTSMKKRLIKAEIFNGINYNAEYYECFKNPTSTEWKAIIKEEENNRARCVLLENGDLYIWSSSILHNDAVSLFNIPEEGVHLTVNKRHSISEIYITKTMTPDYLHNAFVNTTSLYNFLSTSANIYEIDTFFYNATDYDFYDNIKTINNILEYNQSQNVITAEIFEGINYKDNYIECFKNPTSSEWSSVLKESHTVRGILLDNGDVYIWPFYVLHDDAVALFNLPEGIHFTIGRSNFFDDLYFNKLINLEYLYNAFTNTITLYNYVDKNAYIREINTKYYGATHYDVYDNIETINDIVIEYNKQLVTANKK